MLIKTTMSVDNTTTEKITLTIGFILIDNKTYVKIIALVSPGRLKKK